MVTTYIYPTLRKFSEWLWSNHELEEIVELNEDNNDYTYITVRKKSQRIMEEFSMLNKLLSHGIEENKESWYSDVKRFYTTVKGIKTNYKQPNSRYIKILLEEKDNYRQLYYPLSFRTIIEPFFTDEHKVPCVYKSQKKVDPSTIISTKEPILIHLICLDLNDDNLTKYTLELKKELSEELTSFEGAQVRVIAIGLEKKENNTTKENDPFLPLIQAATEKEDMTREVLQKYVEALKSLEKPYQNFICIISHGDNKKFNMETANGNSYDVSKIRKYFIAPFDEIKIMFVFFAMCYSSGQAISRDENLNSLIHMAINEKQSALGFRWTIQPEHVKILIKSFFSCLLKHESSVAIPVIYSEIIDSLTSNPYFSWDDNDLIYTIISAVLVD